jgi:hypothetical protein
MQEGEDDEDISSIDNHTCCRTRSNDKSSSTTT